MSSQVDQKRAFNKLRHDLEPWRNIIVVADSLLTWEKTYYPAIIAGVITMFYFTLWFLDLSVVTLSALTGLIFIAFDYAYPFIARIAFKNDDWDSNKEMRYDRVCEQLSTIKFSIKNLYDYLFSAKERKTHLFAIVTTVSLLALAWIGAIINNLLLMYLITMAIFLYPGIKERSILSSCKSLVGGKVPQCSDRIKKVD